MRILAFLQNQYFNDPDKVREIYARYPTKRNYFIRQFLFMGCLTGRRLRAAFGEDLCDQIVWEEISPEIGGVSNSSFPADIAHIEKAIEDHKPDLILSFGKLAGDAIRAMGLSVPILYAPHPAARQNPMVELRKIADRLREQS